jgi:hypothetical protein
MSEPITSPRKIVITLECELSNLPAAEMRRHAKEAGMKVSELGSAADVSPEFLAQQIEGLIMCEPGDEILWEGTDHFARVTSVRALKAKDMTHAKR